MKECARAADACSCQAFFKLLAELPFLDPGEDAGHCVFHRVAVFVKNAHAFGHGHAQSKAIRNFIKGAIDLCGSDKNLPLQTLQNDCDLSMFGETRNCTARYDVSR